MEVVGFAGDEAVAGAGVEAVGAPTTYATYATYAASRAKSVRWPGGGSLTASNGTAIIVHAVLVIPRKMTHCAGLYSLEGAHSLMSLLPHLSTRYRGILLLMPMTLLVACGSPGAQSGQAPGASATAHAILSRPVTNLPDVRVSFTATGLHSGSYTITQPSKAYFMALLLKNQELGIDAKDTTWQFNMTIAHYTGPGVYTLKGGEKSQTNTGYRVIVQWGNLSPNQVWGIASNSSAVPSCQVHVRSEVPLGTLNFDSVYEIQGDFTCSQVPSLSYGVPGPIDLTNGQFDTPMTVCNKSC